jgi:hypothetical protein
MGMGWVRVVAGKGGGGLSLATKNTESTKRYELEEGDLDH